MGRKEPPSPSHREPYHPWPPIRSKRPQDLTGLAKAAATPTKLQGAQVTIGLAGHWQLVFPRKKENVSVSEENDREMQTAEKNGRDTVVGVQERGSP